MLRRKIERQMRNWKETPCHSPLLIRGCRRCGKTLSVRRFAETNYPHVVYLNFLEDPDSALIFSGSLKPDHLIMLLSAKLGEEATFVPGETVLILDGIQECPEARTALKFFKVDGRFDVIGISSHPGANHPRSIPVGAETVLDMCPLDYEEFLWANGISEDIIRELERRLETETPVPEALHHRMGELLLQYLAVGGMSEAVTTFLETRQMDRVLRLQRDIVQVFREDMTSSAGDREGLRIRSCFDSIPGQLDRENGKFRYSMVKKGSTASEYEGSLRWMEEAGLITRCFNLSAPELPLDANAKNSVFKVYMRDCGLFVSMLEDGTQFDILQGRLQGYHGALYGSLLADIFGKTGRELYYFRRDSGLEVDFVIRYRGEAVLVEGRPASGNTKSARTVLEHPETYHVRRAVRLGDGNVGRSGQILMLPRYMAFLLRST